MQLPFTLLAGGSHRCTRQWSQSVGVTVDYHRFYFPRYGRAWIERDGTRVELRAGRIVLIPGYRPIRFGCDDRLDLEWLHFRAVDVATQLKLAQLPRSATWPAHRWAAWKPVYRRVGDVFEPGAGTPVSLRVQAMLLCFMAELLPRLGASDVAALQQDLSGLQPAIAFMDAHFRDNPPLAEIAALVHLSPTHFHRRFRHALHMSPRHYMLCRRMELARQLLQRNDLNVTEVAEACGYESLFHFSRVFRKFFRRSPRQARKADMLQAP